MDDAIVMPTSGLDVLIACLTRRGFQVWGARETHGALDLAPIQCAGDLPRGRVEAAEAGVVRMVDGSRDAYFDHTLPAQGLKRLAFPPEEELYEVGPDLVPREVAVDAPLRAVIGARACDIAALDILERPFMSGPFKDERFRKRREALLLVAVNCMRASPLCFCASMGTGPRAEAGYDLALDEIIQPDRHVFLVSAGSERGREILAELPGEPPVESDVATALDGSRATAASQMRRMPDGIEDGLKQQLDHPHWAEIGERCLSCANCTMVCPTCFCSTVEDSSSLVGSTASRGRRWDSCFSLDFSFMHGGAARQETGPRYRQWMTHKLAHWHDQFGTSGCVGCGRCIGWCPVGIDITAEAAVFVVPESDGGSG